MTPDYHHIGFKGLSVANPVTLEAIEAMAGRTALPEGSKVLDIGAGTGGVAVALARRYGWHVHAIERDDVMCDLIAGRVRAAKLENRVSVVRSHSNEALDALSPAQMIVALGTTEAAGRGLKTVDAILQGLAERLEPGGWLLWGDLVWTSAPPPPLKAVIDLSGVYADDAGWKAAGAAAGLDCAAVEFSPQTVWDDFFGEVDRKVREWLEAHPRDPGFKALEARADQVKAVMDFGRAYLGFGLYLFRKS